MDAKGYERITQAVEGTGITDVLPRPQEGENVRFVTLEYTRDIVPADVLNALGAAGLAYRAPARTMDDNGYPNLHVIGMMTGSITFEDKTVTRNR
ncbi:MAG TPA: hypothetical protein VD735_06655 [Candidatus Saccharimonadales bacterium]|nr:hypothetical protein [Candidatus Saccharimonadales bacterium]